MLGMPVKRLYDPAGHCFAGNRDGTPTARRRLLYCGRPVSHTVIAQSHRGHMPRKVTRKRPCLQEGRLWPGGSREQRNLEHACAAFERSSASSIASRRNRAVSSRGIRAVHRLPFALMTAPGMCIPFPSSTSSSSSSSSLSSVGFILSLTHLDRVGVSCRCQVEQEWSRTCDVNVPARIDD